MRRDEFPIVYKFAQRQVNDVLDKIRAEIMQMPTISSNANDIYKADILAIIDRYKTESEDDDDDSGRNHSR